MATEVVKTIRASGGDYSSLAAWEAGEQRDLVAADEIAVAECYNDWPNGHNYGGGVDVNGWSADYYCYVVVRAAPGHGHNGVRGAGFRLEGGWGVPITLSTPYSVVQDIEAVGPGYTAAIELKGNTCKVQRCIAEGSSETINSSSVGGIIESCISYSSYAPWSGTGYYLSGLYGHVRHCMSVGAREGFYFRRPQTATNCVAYGAAVPFSGEDPAANWSGNNAATVALGSKAGPSPHPYLITSADFTDAANGDFSLSATSTLSGAGRYLAGAVDITGVSFVAPVSIGPFENSIGGGLTLTVNDALHAHYSDVLGLAQKNTILVAGTLHGHAVDSLTLSQKNTLAVAESNHAVSSDAITLSQSSVLIVSDSTHSHAADAVAITQKNTLVTAGSLHGHAADNIALSSGALLAVQSVLHAHTTDSLALAQRNTLSVQEALHSIGSDNLTLSNSVNLTVFDSTHSHTAVAVTLTQANILAVQDAIHTVGSDNLSLITDAILIVDSALHALISDTINFNIGSLETPASRTFVVPFESRVFVVPYENRIYIVKG